MHPPIRQGFLGVCTYPPVVVTEWAAHGSLYDVLHAACASPAKAAKLTWHRRLTLVGRMGMPARATGWGAGGGPYGPGRQEWSSQAGPAGQQRKTRWSRDRSGAVLGWRELFTHHRRAPPHRHWMPPTAWCTCTSMTRRCCIGT